MNVKKIHFDKTKPSIVYNLTIKQDSFDFASSITSALEETDLEIQTLNETISSVQELKPECDKLDYILAASSGALCGIIDIFLVGKPGESPLGNITDQWFSNRTKDFAKLCGWKGEGDKSAIRFLENKFKVPYDQHGLGDSTSKVLNLTPKNHHFKSLSHNPTLLGLFCSILDQFKKESHFISYGRLISINDASGFELIGHNIPSKLFCAFVNWFGHLISDMSGASGSAGRGMGIPSPFLAWTNDIIAIKNKLGFSDSSFGLSFNELALKLFERGYDARFQTAQAIPVLINELVARLIYAVRRLVIYYSTTDKEERSFAMMWKSCEPFSNATVNRMLTAAHGTFCLVDLTDATVRGFITGVGSFNPQEFFLRLNIIGVGRFAISLYGEGKRVIGVKKAEREANFAEKEKLIVKNYIEGLKILSVKYDDKILLSFVNDFQKSDLYTSAFDKTVKLAELREVPSERILRNKSDIDAYFRKG